MLKSKHESIKEHPQYPYPDVRISDFHFNQHFLSILFSISDFQAPIEIILPRACPKFVFVLGVFSIPEIIIILQPTAVFLPRESHERINLTGCNSPYGCKESDMTEAT